MKVLKLSKTSQLMLAVGVFIVILASLGISRSHQMQEKGQLDEQLYMSEIRLGGLTITELQEQQATLQAKLDEEKAQISGAKASLHQDIESVDVTDKFFVIAKESNVTVSSLSTTLITELPLENIMCSMISLSAAVKGDVPDLIDFIINLNEGYVSGYIGTAQIVIPENDAEGEEAQATLQMTIYSYEGDDRV